MKKLISIILPIYNGEKYMRESIDSILKQSYTNWELLIIDDGSTDDTPVISVEYEAKDSRIHYYKNEQNMRLPRTLNRGFSLAKGDYLTWTSDDNYYYPTALEKMVHALASQNKDFVFASCDVINAEGEIVEVISVNDHSPKMLVGNNPVGACFMYSRKAYEVTGDYDPELTLVEDFDYWQRIATKFPPVCISEKLYAYRWHDGALTSTMKKDQFNRTLERTLLKNRESFGKIDAEQKYYYYKGLHQCRVNLNDTNDPYYKKYKWYSFVYLLQHRIPNKIKRMLNKN